MSPNILEAPTAQAVLDFGTYIVFALENFPLPEFKKANALLVFQLLWFEPPTGIISKRASLLKSLHLNSLFFHQPQIIQ